MSSQTNQTNEAYRSLPATWRQLRACLLCSLIKNYDQFKREGCDNCDEIVHFRNNSDRVAEGTSSQFEGMISSMKPMQSWVAKYKKIDSYVPGIYAVGVVGRIPEWMEDACERNGVQIVPRTGEAHENERHDNDDEG